MWEKRSSFEGVLFHGPKNVLSKDATILVGFTFRSPAVKKEIILTGFFRYLANLLLFPQTHTQTAPLSFSVGFDPLVTH